jgi:hypothetical protein
MSWNPEGGPPGWQPPGWEPDSGEVTPPAPVGTYVPRHRVIVITANCGASKVLEWCRGKLPDEPARYKLDFTDEVTKRWRRGQYTVGECIRVGGYDAVVTVGGQTGLLEPRWTQGIDDVVLDGSVSWRIQAPSTDSLIQVASISWVLPDGMSLADQENLATETSGVPTGGESGNSYTLMIKVRYTDGEGFDQPCVLRVE